LPRAAVYRHCAEKYLHRYLSEYDLPYSYRVKLGCSDATRADKAPEGIKRKRLMYRRTHQQELPL
jgi:hypothetical protein